MKKIFKKIGILSLTAAMSVPMFAASNNQIAAEEISTYAVDAEGYNVLGSLLTSSVDGNKVDLTISTGEKIRFTFLENNVFRMYMAPEGETFKEYPDANSKEHTATITSKTDAQYEAEYKVAPKLVESEGTTTISTDKLIIEIDQATSMIKVMKADRSVVWEETAPLKYKSGSTVQTLKTEADEYFYGGGTQNGRFSHKGKSIEILNSNNWVDKGVASPNPFYWSTGGYGVVRNTWKPGTYDFDSKAAGSITTTHKEKRFDAYYFIDDTPVQILGDYYELTGTPAELPEYASYLGHLNCYNRDYWLEVPEGTSGAVKLGTKWYKESQSDNGGQKETLLGDAESTAEQIIKDHKSNDMPLGWFLPNDGYGCGYGQTTSQAGDIDNLKDFSDYAIANGIQTGLWTQSNLWPADPSNPQKGERDIYKEVDAGVHSVKTDVAWVGAGYSMALNGISVAYNAISSRSGLKPNIVTLDGWAGSQRYAGIWSGDQSGGQWEYIRFHIPTYIGTSLSGQPNIGSDMDGIFGGKNATIQTRDFQWKAFTTYMLDMDGWGSNQKSPWALGEDATSINRAYLKMKAELMPYINTTSHTATAKGGLPMLRAMFLEEENAYTLGTGTQYQYMWGDNFLIAPVYQNTAADAKGNDIRNDIYLPGTSDIWIDYFTGEQYRGGQVLNSFDAPIWKLPVFVKNGSIIPKYTENNNPEPITESNKDGLDRSKRIVEFYPHGETSFELYEDDGLTLGGASTTTMLTSAVDGDKATLKADKTVGNYSGIVKERSTEFVVNVSEEPSKVTGKVAGSNVTFKKVDTQEAYDKAEGNVYFYNATPSIFVKDYATKGTTFANTDETTRPKLFVKSADKVDITAHDFEVVVNGFKNEQDLGVNELNEAIAVPTGLSEVSKSDSEITIGWDDVAEAQTYDVEVDGTIFRNVKDTSYLHVGLNYLTDHTYRVRSVNETGYSNWSELINIQTADNPYRNVPSDIKATWTYGDQWGALKNAFDHDTNTMFHSTNAVKPEDMMVIDMGAAYQMDKFTYQPRMDNKGNGTVSRMDVYASLDGINYKKVWDGAANPEWTYNKSDMEVQDIKTIDLSGHKARYLKLSVLSSSGGFFSASELTPYKKDGTNAWIVGDVNNSGAVDENDLVFYENYIGLKPIDSDWEYSALGNIDNNDIIDAYDVSFVARMLGEPIVTPAKGVEGKVEIIPSKTDIKAGDLVTLDFYGIGLKNVNAFSFEMPVDSEQFEVTNFGSPSTSTVFMRNFSKTRFHSDGSIDNYVCFTNVGKQDLINGTGSLSKVTIKATKDFTWDTKATRALLVGQDLSTADALIDNTQVPELPETKAVLKSSDIKTISFDNDIKTGMDGSELWQQTNWRDILFDGDKSGTLAEFKWYMSNDNIAAEVKLPTDMNFTFNKSEPLKQVKVYNRVSSNGRVTSIKATGYDGATPYDLGTFSSAQNIFTFEIPAAAAKIDRVTITPMTSIGAATGTTTGTEENRMLSLYEIEFLTDSTVNATGISFDSTSASKVFAGAMGEVSATVTPNNVSNPFYNITSSDESIAKIVKIPTGTKYVFAVQGISAGTVTLTATSEDGSLTATHEVTIVDGVDTTKLDDQIGKVEALYKHLYTTDTWSALNTIYEDAKILIASNPTQAQIDDMTTSLIKATNGLKFKGSNKDQESSLNLLSRENMSLYDESSFTAAEKEHGDNVLDGDINTFWHSNYNAGYKLPQWVTIDLGAEYDLEQIDYLARQNNSNGHITHYRIEVALDEPTTRDTSELTFIPVVEGFLDNDGNSLDAPGVAKEIKFDKTTARYVRFMAIESLGTTKNAYASIAELNFYGTSHANFGQLEELIAEAQDIIDADKEDKMTTSSWGAFDAAFTNASALDDTATPEQISEAIAALELAINNLETKASSYVVDALVSTLNICKGLESEYTVAEFADMKALIAEIDVIVAKNANDISSREATQALSDLLDAKLALEKNPTADKLLENLELHVLIAQETLDEEDLSNIRPGKIQALKDAIATGQALIDASSKDKTAILNATAGIADALQELWEILDKTELQALITIAEGKEQGNYTEASWNTLVDALAAAKLTAANDDATTSEMATAYATLNTALAGLKEEVVLNKDALLNEINIVKNMLDQIDKYVPSSVSGLAAAHANAKTVHDTATTQAEIDAATKALTTAKLKARLKADKTLLQNVMARANGINLDGYSAASVSVFRNAFANAEAVLANENATAQEVETVVKALNSAIDGLKKASGTGSGAGTSAGSTTPGKAASTAASTNANVKSGDATNTNELLALGLLAGGALIAMKKRRKGNDVH